MAALGYTDAKVSFKKDAVPTLFSVVEAILMPLIRRTRTEMTPTMPLGSKARASQAGCQALVLWLHLPLRGNFPGLSIESDSKLN